MSRTILHVMIGSVVVVMAISLHVRAQQGITVPAVETPQPVVLAGTLPPPQTRVEAISMRKSSVIVRSYGEPVVLNGDDGSLLRVSPIEVRDLGAELRETGLLITLRGAGRSDEETTGYIDRDEIGSVITALGTLGKIAPDAAVHMDGSFRTRGEIEIANLEMNGSRMLAVRGTQIVAPTGQITTANALFRLSRLGELDRILKGARDALDDLPGSREGSQQ